MYKTIFTTVSLRMEDIVNAFDKVGFDTLPIRDRVPKDVVWDALNVNPEHKKAFMKGRAELFPLDYREFRNRDDLVKVLDYEIREPIRVSPDPVTIIEERILGSTSLLVKEVLERELEIDSVKYAYLKGLSSEEFKRCILELAQLTSQNPRELYTKYADAFVKSWVPILEGRSSARMPIHSASDKGENYDKEEARKYEEIALSAYRPFAERMDAIKHLRLMGTIYELWHVAENGLTNIERNYASNLNEDRHREERKKEKFMELIT